MNRKTKEYAENLPRIAKKALLETSDRTYLMINPNYMVAILGGGNKKQKLASHGILAQIKPNSRIQYVILEDPKQKEHLLSIGLIKETKKGGADTYIVPKDVALSGIDTED